MKICLYSVYDEKAMFFGAPFSAKTDGEAVRMFGDAVNSPDSLFFAHPEDFSLYKLGTYNDNNACVTCAAAPIVLCRATELQRVSNAGLAALANVKVSDDNAENL